MYDFIKRNFKGIYCAMCDAEYNKFIDLDYNWIFFSEEYCWVTLDKSLIFLKYFYINIIEIFNISELFFSSCDFKGEYTLVDLPNIFNIDVTDEI